MSESADRDRVDDETVPWGQFAREVAKRLAAAPLGTDTDEAAWAGRQIVMRASGTEAGDWSSVSALPATRRGVAAIDAMTARRLAGEPLQYVLGEWSFRYLDLYIDKRVLIPRPETEVVAGAALAEAERVAPGGTPILIVDLGTGSGAIGLALATEHSGASLWLTDRSSDALAVARANIAGIGRAGARVRVSEGSWFEALPSEMAGDIGVIVANPPYVAEHEELPPEVIEWEPADALIAGPNGTEDLDHLVGEAPRWLAADGALVLEMAPTQTADLAAKAATRFAEVEIGDDLAGRQRFVVARRPLSH